MCVRIEEDWEVMNPLHLCMWSISFGILGAANWSYQWFNPNGTLTEREVAEFFVEMILDGFQSV